MHTRGRVYFGDIESRTASIMDYVKSKYNFLGESSQSKKNSMESVESQLKAGKASVEIGKSSRILCKIFAKRKQSDKFIAVKRCTHRFCTKCITKHVEVILQKRPVGNKRNVRKIPCPGLDCGGVLKIDACRKILPKDVVSMWDDVICESMIDSSQKFYCPYKDCSGLMVNDGRSRIKESECPFCHRLFCARCRVPWHSDMRCREFLKVNKEDQLVLELAKKKKWQKCPWRKFLVEKKHGCLHMTCRCGREFCYGCGKKWSLIHGGCRC